MLKRWKKVGFIGLSSVSSFINASFIATLVDPTSFDYLNRGYRETPSLNNNFVAPSNKGMSSSDFSKKNVSEDKK